MSLLKNLREEFSDYSIKSFNLNKFGLDMLRKIVMINKCKMSDIFRVDFQSVLRFIFC